MKLGYGDRKTFAPQNSQELCQLLAQMMAASINGEIEPEQAKLALNAATRIVEVQQADTRMRVAAHMMKTTISASRGWESIDPPKLETTVSA